MTNDQIEQLITIINNRLKIIFQSSTSCQKDTLWYNSMTTLLDQCTYDVERAIHDFFKTNVIVNKKMVDKGNGIVNILTEIKDMFSDFLVQYHNYEGKK